MTPELIAILGMGVTILGSTWMMNRSLRSDLKSEISEIRVALDATNVRISALSERMAHLEGLLEGLREAITSRSAA